MRLRTRVLGAFILVSLPGATLSLTALGLFDQLIQDEIGFRTRRVHDETRRLLDDEQAEIADRVRTAGETDAARNALRGAPSDPARLESWAPEQATQLGLDLLALVRRSRSGSELVSSAHLPLAVGDPPAPLGRGLRPGETRTGFVLELVDGNPPERVPALVSVYASAKAEGGVWVYGGRRLDARLLGRMARMADARVSLQALGKTLETHPGGPPPGAGALSIPLHPLGTSREVRVTVAVDTARLWSARRRLLTVSGLLWALTALVAIGVGGWLSARITGPILELAKASARVGAGDLNVRVPRPRTRDEVAGLVDVFNRMTEEVAEARERIRRAERIAAWREVARRLAHEIKNPLSPMRLGMANLRKAWAQQHPQLGEIVEESTRSVLEEVSALDRLVSDFSAFARLPPPVRRSVAPEDLLASVTRLYEGRIQCDPKAIKARRLPHVWADPDHITRALVNLIKNAQEALEAAGRPGAIRVDARMERSGVILEVEDDGPGMSEDTRKRASEAYFTTKSSGTGLGMAIVERTLEEHEGTMRVFSRVDVGTRVALWLPISAEEPNRPHDPGRPP